MMTSTNSLLLVAALLPASLLTAQVPATRPVTDTTKAGATASHPSHADASDAVLATWLHSACTHHIAIATIAVKQSKNPEVVTFAQKLIDDHTACAQKLVPFTTATVTAPAKTGDAAAGKPVPIAADAKATPAAAGFDHAALARDLGARCLQSATKQLTAKSGAEFDRCFLQMEVASHQQGIDTVEVFKTYASPRLRPALDEALSLLTAHHERAVALNQKNAIVASTGGSR